MQTVQESINQWDKQSRNMAAQNTIKFGKLKQGQAFQLECWGDTFVRCRGGYRSGRGGQLQTCKPNMPVIFSVYNQ